MKKIRLLVDVQPYKVGDILEVDYEDDDSIEGWISPAGLLRIFKKEDLEKTFEFVTYIVITDDDGHWYLIDKKDREKFDAWVEATSNWKDTDDDFDGNRIPGHPANFVSILDYEELD